MSFKNFRLPLWILVGVSLLIGLWALVQRITGGHEVTAYGSYVPWGLWVSMYVYFISIPTGFPS